MNKLMDWAVFGLMGYLWYVAMHFATGNGYATDNGFMVVTVFTVAMMMGGTSGGSVFEHMMNGLSGCVNWVVGWIVASLVYGILYQLMGTGFDAMALGKMAGGTVMAYVTAMLATSCANSIKS